MAEKVTRRGFLAATAVAATVGRTDARPQPAVQKEGSAAEPLRLGIMTYTLAKDWDIDTIIKNCTETKFEHAELRTTHAHGVEVSLTKAQRAEVRKRFSGAGIKLSLASGFQYHYDDAAKVRKNIEGTKEYTLLAQDLGALGIRVFPNAVKIKNGIPDEKTLERIGKAVAEVGEFAHNHGVEIRLANHGRGTNDVVLVKKMIDYSQSKHVYMNWNCDGSDVKGIGFDAKFNLVKDRIRNIHLHELTNEAYPYRRLFELLRANGYQGYCDAEIKASPEPIRLMRYYRALFLALQDAY